MESYPARKPSSTSKAKAPVVSRLLTPSEIEALRRDKRESIAELRAMRKEEEAEAAKAAEKTNAEKAPEPPKRPLGGFQTDEERGEFDRTFSENVKKGVADWEPDHPNGEKPKFY